MPIIYLHSQIQAYTTPIYYFTKLDVQFVQTFKINTKSNLHAVICQIFIDTPTRNTCWDALVVFIRPDKRLLPIWLWVVPVDKHLRICVIVFGHPSVPAIRAHAFLIFLSDLH
eukprot:NODE_197_length_15379_cov_0.485602.p9 type:complete len:113 gc:universal NODE_197_length_15379_cov_0.485602:13789-13451(-)